MTASLNRLWMKWEMRWEYKWIMLNQMIVFLRQRGTPEWQERGFELHTIGCPIKRYQGLWFYTWRWPQRKIWVCFLPKTECRLSISLTLFCQRETGIITNISKFNLMPIYRHHKLMIQRILIVQGPLMEFIYDLRLICRVEIILCPCT